MNLRRLSLALALCACSSFAAEDAPKSSAREALRARIAEDAKKVEPKKSPAPAAAAPTDQTPAASAPDKPATMASSPTAAAPGSEKNAPATKAPAKAADPFTVMPKVEVKKGRITVLDQKLAKQEEDIARERKNTKSSEVDDALNDAKLARPLAIFGGDSTQFRKNVASERVELMEAEKDLIEAIAHAKTKEEKAMLQKQLDELRTMRRELDKTMR